MKGSIWKLMYLFCAMAGILAGYGIFTLTGTKDNTLVREDGNSVFFYEETEHSKQPEASVTPKQEAIQQEPVPSVVPSLTEAPDLPTPTPVSPTPMQPTPTRSPLPPEITIGPTVAAEEDKLPSLGVQWAVNGENVPQIPMPSVTPTIQESPATQTITYPIRIFGQEPVINRSDAYVSYFEFCYDLIAILEPVVSARGLNMNSLLTKFAIKALFCGVDIEKLDINAPIPRRLAALCVWLAAQILNESGCDTSAKSAGGYVTDIAGCSASEKKAIAYLYETGILKGYQVSGQRFYPENGLKTEAGTNWLSAIKQHWK